MTKESRPAKSTTRNVVAFPKNVSQPNAAVPPLKLISKNDRRKVGHDTVHLQGRQAVIREDVSSITVEVMVAVFSLLTVLVYVNLS